MSKGSICVLVSGGLDSGILLADTAERYRQVQPLYVRQGLAWENAELFWLKKFIRALGEKSVMPLQILSIPMNDLYGAHWSTGKRIVPGRRSRDEAVYLPGRNLILSVKAAVFAAMNRIPRVALGSLEHNPFPDASLRFFRLWGKALSTGLNAPVQIVAPYRQLSKNRVILRGKKWPLHLTFSCISPRGNKHCGACNKCAERRRGFKRAGIEDATHYAKN